MTMILAFGMPAAPEWIFISILALVLFGPKKLPELARGLGKALAELQKAKEDFHREITGVPPMPRIQPQGGLQPTIPDATPPSLSSTENLETTGATQGSPQERLLEKKTE